MTQPPSVPTTSEEPVAETPTAPTNNTPPPSYVKLAMRNMVLKRATSLFHFALTAAGLLGVLVGLAFLDRYFNS
ncbi:MAG: DUF3285 domain-containing protein [Oscillatoriales cyanobacterium]|uniref:DUF3285 domain-containing protein n=1 Tax=Microcoleus anatoxicus PTRS2 TaxID=2705321 RepID=A0ABU8YQ31_9CYAN|nr:MAG: DUF3285 domain-containing protein [Oscillatoriales cyanobacterium]TAD95724.1 MAG: DUF3285 domain-containing protein [Oscillatoriales cyanobacterium]TAE00139.1 MAG: DUF3285 domain-containing protein [Oscillatoriales cyanobacterium]TAF06294.1 MAG: DUF3285 domain-containing protein [Oscillatoriales cyanobacterium]TAF46107.1 MAG: DUF3285 domain-containing protein [Oscillatoriales cyanobacterium]